MTSPPSTSPTATGPTADAPGPSGTARPGFLGTLLAGARRWWPFAALAGLVLGGGAATAYYTLTPQKHTVALTLQIIALDPLLSERPVQGQDLDYRKAQAALIHTRLVIQKALENKKVAQANLLRDRQDPAGWLENEIKTLVMDGGLIRVTLTGESPDELALTLNEISKAYLSEVVDAEERQRHVRADEVDKLLALSENRIHQQRSQLRSMAETLRTSDTQALSIKQQTVLQKHAFLQSELLGLESKLRLIRAQIAVLKKSVEASKTDALPESLVLDALAADPVVKPAADEVQRLTLQIEKSKDTVSPESATALQMAKALKTAEEHLKTVKEQRRDEVRKRAREMMVRQTSNSLALQEVNEGSLELQRAELAKAVDTALLEAGEIGHGSIDLELKRSEIGEAESILRRLRAEKERLAIEMQTYKSRVRVLSAAEAAAAKPAASALVATIAIGVGGLALGVLGVGYLESRRRRLVHSRDVAHATKLKVFGNIPLVPGLESAPLTDVWGLRFGILGSHLVEAVNDARNVLLAHDKGRNHKVVTVTSACKDEGKTTLATLLALSIAQVGKRTLLVDADLRNPRVAERLSLPPAAGFGELLRGDALPDAVIGTVPETTLAIITAGRPCSTVIRGLSVERVNRVVADLRERFDFIIVDTSPTSVSDGLVIGGCADAALLVVRSGQSDEPAVREACERMAASHVPLAGCILNGVSPTRRVHYPYVTLATAARVHAAAAPGAVES